MDTSPFHEGRLLGAALGVAVFCLARGYDRLRDLREFIDNERAAGTFPVPLSSPPGTGR